MQARAPLVNAGPTKAGAHLSLRSSSRGAVRARSAASPPQDSMVQAAVGLYEQVWSNGRVLMLDTIMAEDHVQADMVWQPERRASGGRRSMKRGILAYRAAYPDIRFRVLCVSVAQHQPLRQSPQAHTPESDAAPSSSSSSSASGVAGSGDVGGVGADSSGSGHVSSDDVREGHHGQRDTGAGAATTKQHQQQTQQQQQQQPGEGQQEQPCCSVIVHWAANGTNLGPIREAPPSGKKVSFTGISRLDFNAQGQIQKSHVYRQAPADEAAYFLSQGIYPGAPPKEAGQS